MLEIRDILHYLRCCLNCGSLSPLPGNFLCRQCWSLAKLDLSKGKVLRTGFNGKKFEALALFNWYPQKNDALSAYLAALKYWQGQSQWDEIAGQLIYQRTLKNQNWPRFDLVVPAASHRSLESDHSWHLAKALSAKLQIPVLSMLEKVGSASQAQKQRGMGKFERQLLRVKRSEKFSQMDLSERRVLWVDDVITTGATARASLGALSPVQSCEIWCVAQRALL